MSCVYLHKFSLRHSGYPLKPAWVLAIEYSLGVLAAEGANHVFTL